MLYGCDYAWWRANIQAIRDSGFVGELWTQATQAAQQWGLHRVAIQKHARGLCMIPGSIAGGSNSGYQVINLAAQFGAKRIALLGYDFQRTGGKSHWHGDHPRPLGNLGNLQMWREHMGLLARDLAAAGIEVINASRETALTCFRRRPLEEVLK